MGIRTVCPSLSAAIPAPKDWPENECAWAELVPTQGQERSGRRPVVASAEELEQMIDGLNEIVGG